MKRKFQIIFFLALCFTTGKAWSSIPDTLILRSDPRMDYFVLKQAQFNKLLSRKTSKGHIKGYRLQILTNSREEAYQIKSKLLMAFPEQKAYLLYQAPAYKIRFGNFQNWNSAEKYRKMLSRQLNQSIYLIEDNIEVPSLNETE